MISKNILDAVKELSLSDKKNLSQKVCKSMEELGELAKATLPIDDAFATKHRFADKQKALEEVCDTLLCVLSVGYDLGFEHQDISEMLETKMKVWAELQAKEGLLNSRKIPFEIHITVSADSGVEDFKRACLSLDVKPILLDLHLSGNESMKDLMTSSVFIGTNKGAYEEMVRISLGLQRNGFEVLRQKIETVPWHPAAPSTKFESSKMPESCYFESHLNILTSRDRLDELAEIANKHSAKRSTNIWKDMGDDKVKVMVTLRSYNLFYEPFLDKLQFLKDALIEKEFSLDKEIVEFSIFDTKVSHDVSWISGDKSVY